MRDLFRGYYQPTAAELAEIWQDCIFSFDANVLLNFYCYTPETRQIFFQILHQLQNRIWLPYQAAYEYQKNRILVIANHLKAYEDLERVLNKKLQELRFALFPEYKCHPFINSQQILDNFELTIEETKSQLRIAKSLHPNYLEFDEIRELLSDLFQGKVGQAYSEEELEDIYQKAEKRFSYKQPPGYKDAHKPVPRSYGDVVLWFQLIDYAKVQQKPIIFVTDDNKEDWWVKYEGKSLEPRPDLIQEILSAVGGESFQFYMYHSDSFINYAEKFLGLPERPEAVKEAREIILQRGKKRISVESNYLQSVGYDASEQVLEIEFKSGEVYQYKDVPIVVYTDLMNASSHGKYFNANIKDVYPNQKLS